MLESFFALLGFVDQSAFEIPPLENLEIHAAPQIEKFSEPVVDAMSAIITDLDSGKVLWSKNSNTRLPIASLTKLMTAVIARENYQLDEVVEVSRNASGQPTAKIWLRQGEKISVENLLKALLIESANDAAVALAEKGDTDKFVKKMNAKASALGLMNTHFANPVGYDDDENFSTTQDLAILANYFLRDEFLRQTAATNKTGIDSVDGGIHHELYSTNNLFGSYLKIRGLKTGLTEAAGECVATIAELENGKSVLAIVLNSPKRFQEAKSLIAWAAANFRW
ncbi:MAG: D-alanyl-D-alanine carboxypeptidase [Candidatus Peribacteraceae bacterium]|nr:D-alanyl-D-alanine carboxypeptidase [Candidatus Peribacteraceae bacterium]